MPTRILLLATVLSVFAHRGAARAQSCPTAAGLLALDREGDPARGRLVSTLARSATPGLSGAERGARCRYVSSMRVVRRAEGSSCAAIVAIQPTLTGCGLSGSAPERFFSVSSDARGRLTGRPMAADDPRLMTPRFDASTPLSSTCAAYEADSSLSSPALATARNTATHFAACEALGVDRERIRNEVVSCLEAHRTGDALVVLSDGSGVEACRVVVRTERVGGASAWTRISTSGAGSAFVHAFASGGSPVCESYGSIDPAGCASGRPLRRASAASCPLTTADARSLASAPAFACADDVELRSLRLTHRFEAPGTNPTAFALLPVLGVLARGRAVIDDAAVNAFVTSIANAATSCEARGSGLAGRHRSDVLITFSVGATGVGAIQTAATSYDQGIATCLASAARAHQATLRAPSSTGMPPIYQFTIAVLRP